MDDLQVLETSIEVHHEEVIEEESQPVLPSTCAVAGCKIRVSRKLLFDRHLYCISCRDVDCTQNSCADCCTWSPDQRRIYANHMKLLKQKRESKGYFS